MTNKYYVYKYTRPYEEKLPAYVGYGCGRRGKSHIWLATNPNSHSKYINPHFANIILKARRLNLDMIYEIVADNLTIQNAKNLEIKLIDEIGRKDLGKGPLANHTNGGDGGSGCIVSLETRKKMSIAQTGKKRSEETKRKVSLAISGGNHYTKRKKANRPKIKKNPLKIKRGEDHHSYGKHITKEHKQKISDAFRKRREEKQK